MSFLNIWLKRPIFRVHDSQGSAETLVRRGGIINHHLIAYFSYQKLPKSVDVHWSYSVQRHCRFFETQCIIWHNECIADELMNKYYRFIIVCLTFWVLVCWFTIFIRRSVLHNNCICPTNINRQFHSIYLLWFLKLFSVICISNTNKDEIIFHWVNVCKIHALKYFATQQYMWSAKCITSTAAVWLWRGVVKIQDRTMQYRTISNRHRRNANDRYNIVCDNYFSPWWILFLLLIYAKGTIYRMKIDNLLHMLGQTIIPNLKS